MTDGMTGVVGFLMLMVFIGLRMPIGIAMGLVGGIGILYLDDINLLAYAIGISPFEATHPYALSVLPLFVMMGVFSTHSGISRKLFHGANALVGHMRGGLGMATIWACAGFGAICGSSLATSATMARIAIPEMQKHNYDLRLAAGAVAAGGTIGIMIPPSLALAMYGILTQTSIGSLYLAALIPGILGSLLYASAVAYVVFVDPKMGPRAAPMTMRTRLKALVDIFDVMLLITLILGGMFGGFFSATEAAAVGVAGAMIIAGYRGMLTRKNFLAGLQETSSTMGMLFVILIGARTFGFFIDQSGLPHSAVQYVETLELSSFWVLMAILAAYLLLGCVLDGLAMMIITIPVVFPIVLANGIDPIWFGILMVTVSEVGLISPPFGMNLFIVQAVRPEIDYMTMVRGVVPFIFADIVRIALLVGFPILTLYFIT